MKVSFKTLFKFFIRYASNHKARFFVAFLAMPLTASLVIAGPDIIKRAIDEGISQKDLPSLATYAWLYLAVVIMTAISHTLQNIFLQTGGLRTLKDIREAVVSHISHLPRSEYEKRPLGVYVSRATSDVETIGETFLQGVSYIFTDSLMIIAIYIYIFMENIYLGLATVIFIPLLILLVNWFRKTLRAYFDEIRTLNGRLSAQLNETFSMLFEIRNFNLAQRKCQAFEKDNHSYRDTSVKAISLEASIYSLIEGFHYLVVGCIFFSLTQIDSQLPFSSGTIVAYILLLQKLFDPIKEMSGRFAVLQSALAALEKIENIMRLELPEDKGIEKIAGPSMKLQNINFSYIKGQPVLKNISLDVRQGGSLAIAGPTGSGKSTLIKILMRQYDTFSGQLQIGGRDIRSISRDELRKNLIMVPQDPAIFHDTILFNITLGRPEVTKEMVLDICQRIHLDRFINRMPDGFNSVLSEAGSNLSCGQRQLIALARALVSPAEILIFDEATANIDSETEILIQNAMNYAMSHKTTVMIAHRLSTIKDAEQIIILKNGEIAESGNHRSLMHQQGLYAKMYRIGSSTE